MKKYVVIGSSAAGVNGIRELRKYDKDAEIVLISKDKDIYSRCILHEYLAGKRSIERLRFVASTGRPRKSSSTTAHARAMTSSSSPPAPTPSSRPLKTCWAPPT